MTNDPRIQQMLDRLPQLDEEEKKLRQEANSVAYPQPDVDGKVEFIVADKERFAAIGQELKDIAAERAEIEDRLEQLKELLGDHLMIPSTAGEEDRKQRLISELALHFEHKVLKSNPRQYILPEDAIKDPRYTTKAAEILPLIEACEIRIKAAEERQATAWAILNT